MDLATLLPLAIKASILLMVLGLGLNATWRDVTYLLGQPSLLIRSLLSMYVVMPLVATALVVAFDLPLAVKIAVIALAISPVPPILPKKELKAGGHVSYAISLLVIIALLSIIIVPLAVSFFAALFGRSGDVSSLHVAKVVFASVLAPLATGIALREWARGFAARIARPAAMLGTVLLFGSAIPLAIASWADMYALVGNGTLLVIAFMVVMGLAIGHLMGGPNFEERTVLALSTATRHPAIALAIAVALGAQTKAGLAAILLYLVVATIVCIPFVIWRKRQWDANKSRVPAARSAFE